MHWCVVCFDNYRHIIIFPECECNTQGTLPGTDCTRLGGQCSCKQGVFGRQCDQCEPGYYNFTERGCDRKYSSYGVDIILSNTVLHNKGCQQIHRIVIIFAKPLVYAITFLVW